MSENTYNVTGMTCDGCARLVKTVLSKVEGVKNVNVDLAQGQATVEAEAAVSPEKLNDALKATAYRVEPKS